MRKPAFFVIGAILAGIFVAGCGGSYTAPPAAGPQTAMVNVSMTDAPPAGITVISFEVSLTGATLNPGNVDLLGAKAPIRIEVKKLETENAFLSRSEERRVGKECRSRWSREHKKKKV